MNDPNACYSCPDGFQACDQCQLDANLQTDLAICVDPTDPTDPESGCKIDEFAQPALNVNFETFYVCTKCSELDANAVECYDNPDGDDVVTKCLPGFIIVDNSCERKPFTPDSS